MSAARKTDLPKIFRITLEVSNIDEAAAFYFGRVLYRAQG